MTMRIALLTLLALLSFAANSLLCRLAMQRTQMDAATFTAIRLLAGTLALWLIVRLRRTVQRGAGDWRSAGALFAYAACFSFAYRSLPTGTGALLLFGAVQATMIGHGLWAGERLRLWQVAGLACALGGLAVLLWPGLAAPSLCGAVLMLSAGVAWGVYSLRGRAAGEPLRTTAENFLRAVPLVLALSFISGPPVSIDGFGYAVASGALASGLGYAVWYAALRGLRATQAATVQLCVPVIAAGGGSVFLGEAPGARLWLSAAAVLGGIALATLNQAGGNREGV